MGMSPPMGFHPSQKMRESVILTLKTCVDHKAKEGKGSYSYSLRMGEILLLK
jgi:hypothetical protein